MEIRTNTRNTTTNTDGKAFTITPSAKAFKILSDGLYSDKITAIIRELSTNALDAHVTVNAADKPFHVHLPKGSSEDELYFSIRDFGNSMTHDQVMELYTTYFGSDKTGSNEFVGALGLGSKSPFSYTDSFSITAILDGDMRSYVAFMDQNGIPTISMLKQQKTTDPNGVEIKFAVKQDDVEEFSKKARRVYRFFPVKPEVTGGYDYKHRNDSAFIASDTWSLVKEEHWNKSSFALQGNIAYKIEEDNFTRSNKAYFVAKNSFHVQFDIGQLDVSASREALSYDAVTLQNITARFEQVYDEFMTKANEIVSAEPTEWLAKLRAQVIFKSVSLSYGEKIPFEYNGKPLGDVNQYKLKMDDFPEGFEVYKYWQHSTYRTEYIKREHITKKESQYGKNTHFGILVDPNAIFVYDDGANLKAPRVRHLANTSGRAIYLFEGSPRKFKKAIGNPAVRKLSDLGKPPREPRVSQVNGQHYFAYGAGGINVDNGLTVKDLPKGQKFFVELKTKGIMKRGSVVRFDGLSKDLDLAFELGILDPDIKIFGVKYHETKAKRSAKLGMIHLFDYIHTQTADKVAAMKDELDEYFKAQVKHTALNSMGRINDKLVRYGNILDKVHANSKIFEIQTQILDIQQQFEHFETESTEISQLIEMAARHAVEITRPEFSFQMDRLENYYPMLKMVDAYNFDINTAIDYINLVDDSKGN